MKIVTMCMVAGIAMLTGCGVMLAQDAIPKTPANAEPLADQFGFAKPLDIDLTRLSVSDRLRIAESQTGEELDWYSAVLKLAGVGPSTGNPLAKITWPEEVIAEGARGRAAGLANISLFRVLLRTWKQPEAPPELLKWEREYKETYANRIAYVQRVYKDVLKITPPRFDR